MTKTVSINDLLNAAEKNGFLQARSAWFETTDQETAFFERGIEDGLLEYNPNAGSYEPITKIGAACIMGQAVINLGIYPFPEKVKPVRSSHDAFRTRAITLNDSWNYDIPSIVSKLREEFREFLDETEEYAEVDYSQWIEEI